MPWLAHPIRDESGRMTEVHVIPCLESKDIKPPHTLTANCVCNPTREAFPSAICPLYIHHTEQ